MNERNDNEIRAAERMRELLRETDCAGAGADRLAAALRWPVEDSAAAWSRQVMMRAAPYLEARALRVWRRQVAVFVGVAIVALPLTLLACAYGTLLLYQVVCSLLPSSLAMYLVATYVMVALGVLGATYAMIPIAIGRSHDRLVLAQSLAAAFNPTWEDPE